MLNNRPEIIEAEKITFQELIEFKNFTFKFLVTKLNNKLIKKEERNKVQINEGDNVAIIHLISGG